MPAVPETDGSDRTTTLTYDVVVVGASFAGLAFARAVMP